ncbi:MAG: SH3 domain-containing protein [Deltaproteobacteria bacterium]|nr:SH3 domain-containing protein [Deltaproteobacteria bacterium]
MKKCCFSVVVAAMSFFFVISAYAGSAMWVASENAKLKSAPKASSSTVSTLAVGIKISVLKTENRWYRIRAPSGEEGWMYRGKLSDTPPSKETEESGNLFGSMQSSSISADEAQTSRSIRGLSKETEQYAKRRGTPEAYKKALDQVLAVHITDKEVDVFLKSGKIGEYAP